jgi:hypothetical protein
MLFGVRPTDPLTFARIDDSDERGSFASYLSAHWALR